VRAKAESTLMFLLFAALLVGVVGLSRQARARDHAPDAPGRAWPHPGWGIATGVLLGLAFGAKLTAVLAIVAVAVWGIWACLSSRSARRGPRPDALRRDVPWGWPAAVLATAGLVFLLSNPFLWPDPVGRTWLLFENRSTEMSDQRANQPNRAINGLDRRAALVWDRSVFNDAFGPSRLGQPVEAVLAAVGAGWLALRAATRQPTALTLALLWTAGVWIGVTAGLGFLLQHYFVPTAMLGILLAGLASGWAAQAIGRAGARLARRQRAWPPVESSPSAPDAVTAR
jgi:4-amino-4-deoxy-L-arabinose transferase-like glycosyltransferase